MIGFLNDVLGQLFPVLGMGVAWIGLEGSARDVVGWAIVGATVIWFATYWIRKDE